MSGQTVTCRQPLRVKLPPAAVVERIHQLWDELVDHDASRDGAALDHLMQGLCDLVQAQNAVWIGAVRMSTPQSNDPVHGWRPRMIHHLHLDSPFPSMDRKLVHQLEAGLVDPSTVRNVSFAGQYRAHLLAELVPASWFESDFYRAVYLDMGHHDAIWAGVPVNADTESYFGLHRNLGQPRFTPTERDIVAHTLRGLRWFLRREMLGHGLLMASAPLTPVERHVLEGILAGMTEKQIAKVQGHSFNTTHEYVRRLFRKYGVRNRAALMALWVGRHPPN
ncbi:MAG TPA: helix-turn-helix transcriptional regulator [Rhodanobacteraceae bacterium]|nr:helix-turn-helix transcriptional regulator [Rhodanobacteraceae bacterium]